MAKSKSGEFYTFDEVLRQLNIDENRLKRLVSEGEIRAFREGDQMKFKRTEIDGLAGRSGRGGQTSETSLTEISLEDDSQPTVNVGGEADTLADDLLAEPDVSTGGMRTAEISSQDTFIDSGDVGMSTEPIDFTEDEGLDDVEEVEDIGVSSAAAARGGGGRSRGSGPRRVAIEEPRTSPLMYAVLFLALVVSIAGALVTMSIGKGESNSITKWFAETFGGKKVEQPADTDAQ
ncbi:MAG: helix-turn-helix domain-containing protein [Planctomycetota bacterium]|nr:helix-turn-helix domain-containing protein [Planctomycetota bacterium]